MTLASVLCRLIQWLNFTCVTKAKWVSKYAWLLFSTYYKIDLFPCLVSMVNKGFILQCRMKIIASAFQVPFWKCQSIKISEMAAWSWAVTSRLGHLCGSVTKKHNALCSPFCYSFQSQEGFVVLKFLRKDSVLARTCPYPSNSTANGL